METTRLVTTLATGLVLATAPGAWGQSRQIPAPPQDRPVVIHSATVHPVADETIEELAETRPEHEPVAAHPDRHDVAVDLF